MTSAARHADNLPPDPATAAAELSESDSVGILQPLPPEEVPVRQPTIREEMRPFNSRRIDLVEALVQEPKQVTFNGKVYDLKNPDRVRVFYENEQYPTIWTQENKLLDNFEPLNASSLTRRKTHCRLRATTMHSSTA